jgi:hypothetical protein
VVAFIEWIIGDKNYLDYTSGNWSLPIWNSGSQGFAVIEGQPRRFPEGRNSLRLKTRLAGGGRGSQCK